VSTGTFYRCTRLKQIKFSADLNKSGPQPFLDSFWNEGKTVDVIGQITLKKGNDVVMNA
jgi:hypothetical protein